MSMQAHVRLPHIIGDGMVLQQQSYVRLWGWGTPHRQLKVQSTWAETTYESTIGADGKWSILIETPKAGFQCHSLSIMDGDTVKINNILIGEVWVCAGQSNMKMPMTGFDSNPTEGYNEAVIEAVHLTGIRFVEIPREMSMTPLEDAPCKWQAITPASVGTCSAVGYYFARLLNRTLTVPIGLILSNQGGTRVEGWMSRNILENYTDEPTDTVGIVASQAKTGKRAMLWYNGTFHPIVGYSIKGFLFYQGCSNVGDESDKYSHRLSLLVRGWREAFGQGDLPFYFVEIAPYATQNENGIESALLREQQYKASLEIPNSVLIGTNDLVYPWEKNNVHPSQKRPIGERLAYAALHREYGMKALHYKNPAYKSMSIDKDTCWVELDYELGMDHLEDIIGFEIAGDDRIFRPAVARFDRKKHAVKLINKEIRHPVAVRYCFRNFQVGNFKNQVGLPLIPFRTDKW